MSLEKPLALKVDAITKRFGGLTAVSNASLQIPEGMIASLIGPNGAGKTTLIKLLLGLLDPVEGKVKRSPTMAVAFSDQNRDALDPTVRVRDNVAQGDDFILLGDKKKHVIGYLGDFLFSPDKCNSLAGVLSGGEQNRLLLAKLFAKSANVLVLDEPTNDLDVESLEVLETLLLNYEGTVIFISHDREFIDNVATHCIFLSGNGKYTINVGGYSDRKEAILPIVKTKSIDKTPRAKSPRQGLSYQEQKEFDTLPGKIEQYEADIVALEERLADPEFYQKSREEIEKVTTALEKLKRDLNKAYERWEELDKN